MTATIINGNALDELKKLPDGSVDCIVTSPPYYGLRSYKGAETIWGGDPNCEHEFELKKHYAPGQSDKITMHSPVEGIEKKWREGFCSKCGAWKGQLGLEPTYQMYLEHLLMITKELKRVLKKTGTLFWNMGDSYAGNMGKRSGWNDNELTYTRDEALKNGTSFYLKADYGNIQDKSLMMIPERFAIGMIDQGWILRNKIIWYKRNGMPSSVRDRFTNKWEYIFFFVKFKKYFFNLDAVRKPLSDPDRMLRAVSGKRLSQQKAIDAYLGNPPEGISKPRPNIKNILLDSKYLRDRSPNGSLAGRVMRNIADGKLETFVREAITNVNQYLKDKLKESGLTVKQLAEITGEKETMIAHYFRTDLSGASLPTCEFWNKAKDILKLDEYDKHIKEEYKSVLPSFDKGANPGDVIPYHPKGDPTFGMRLPPQPWQEHAFNPKGANPGDFMNIPTRPHKFAHFAVYPETLIEPLIKAGCPEGGTVLDPFAGSGTTGIVAERLGKSSILIEISSEYIDIIKERIKNIAKGG